MADYKDDLHADSQKLLSKLIDDLDLGIESRKKAQNYITEAIENDDISLMGRGIDAIVPAALLLATRETGEVRTANEIARYTPDAITSERIHRTSKYLQIELDLGLVTPDPRDFVERIADELPAPPNEKELANNVIDIMDEEDMMVNKAANTIAAAVFYYISVYGTHTQPYTQSEIAEIIDVSEQTIRNNYRTLASTLPENKLEPLRINPNIK